MLLLVATPEDAERDHHLRWSLWRRRHQAVARQGHRARRAHRPPPAQPGTPTPPGSLHVLVVPGTAEVSETAWAQIAPLVQPPVPRRGRPSGDLRRQLEGMLAVMRSGGPWRDVPPAYGPWQTVYTRYAFWVRTGVWEQIAAILHPEHAQPELAESP